MILSIDQGTTGTTTVIYDEKGQPVAKSYQEITQYYPNPGWVEHDPEEIYESVISTIKALPKEKLSKVTAAGITNQRETTIIWNKNTGKPIYNAIVWQCRRTADMCDDFKKYEDQIREKTGLPLDPYFSATKIKWILENTEITDTKNLLFGTINTWLIWKLTGGKIHATDHTNASRTMLYNIEKECWDEELCKIFNIPLNILPEVKKSIDDFGTLELSELGFSAPICGVAGDQQAALFGQCCFETGQMKNTYGTGCFAILNTGKEKIESKSLVTTLAINRDGDPCFALEGSVFIAGAAVQWLRDELRIIKSSAETEKIAESIVDNGGVYLVPAFVGLGAPYWDQNARGILCGLTRGSGRAQIVRATLESMCYQTYDVINEMEKISKIKVRELAVDGGATVNNFLMQFQADILDKKVLRPKITESTALGAAYLAGLKVGFWKDADELISLKSIEKTFIPDMDTKEREKNLDGWKKAVAKARS